jgi:hypothetical protein
MIDLKPRGEPGSDRDPDGVRIVTREGATGGSTRLLQGLGLLAVAVCVGYFVTPRRVDHGPDVQPRAAAPGELTGEVAPAPPGAAVAAAAKPADTKTTGAAVSSRPLTPRRPATPRANPDAPEEPPELPIPPDRLKDVTMGEYIQALHDAGIHEGIGAFNPPGTSPPLEGLAVPPDYQLPDGYVRHYQATDDGQAIEPILMYSPDFEFFDANGNRIEIPEDRVVPPEHAPPGLPVRIIDIPKPREPGDTAR